MVVLAAVMLVATPLLAFGGGLVGTLIARRSAVELDRWRKREETMRMLRWAIELAVDAVSERRSAGLATMDELLTSPLLDGDDWLLVRNLAWHVARGTMAA